MRLLILGGTGVLGVPLVEAALARGHHVTLFHRALANAPAHAEVVRIAGDRAGDLAALAHDRWDAVIDTSGFTASAVRASLDRLASRTAHYIFVSSFAVYDPATPPPLREAAPTLAARDLANPFGAEKAACEREVLACVPDRALICRPAVLVGPHDASDRFTYWLSRLVAGGEILAPGPPARLTQFIDARDLSAWLVTAAGQGTTGVFNAAAPALPLQALLAMCASTVGRDPRIVWVDEAFLRRRRVVPFVDLPLWLPAAQSALLQLGCETAGLGVRPLAETARDTWAWWQSAGTAATPAAGLPAARERELLRAWHARS
jgi:2'-hydroxyisoflavone reductase